LGVSVNPAGLAPGVYQGSIAINSRRQSCLAVVPVTLNVTNPLALQNLRRRLNNSLFHLSQERISRRLGI